MGGKAWVEMSTLVDDERSIYDPLNLYGENSRERKEKRIRSLEPPLKVTKAVIDPLNIYPNKAEVDQDVDMSDSLPFMPRPISLTRKLAGDVGFDPFNFADTEEKLEWQRTAELKHSRIAMLAAVGWPVSEFLHKPLAHMFHLTPLLVGTAGDRVPSILNGGLDQVNPLYWGIVLAVAGSIEVLQLNNTNKESSSMLWDPLGLYPENPNEQKQVEKAEIDFGRFAMLGITGFAIQEFFTMKAVIG